MAQNQGALRSAAARAAKPVQEVLWGKRATGDLLHAAAVQFSVLSLPSHPSTTCIKGPTVVLVSALPRVPRRAHSQPKGTFRVVEATHTKREPTVDKRTKKEGPFILRGRLPGLAHFTAHLWATKAQPRLFQLLIRLSGGVLAKGTVIQSPERERAVDEKGSSTSRLADSGRTAARSAAAATPRG